MIFLLFNIPLIIFISLPNSSISSNIINSKIDIKISQFNNLSSSYNIISFLPGLFQLNISNS